MPRYVDILEIAEVTINTLIEIGIEHSCFIGGMACKLYTKLYTNYRGHQPKVCY
jgi:hypothetical protein